MILNKGRFFAFLCQLFSFKSRKNDIKILGFDSFGFYADFVKKRMDSGHDKDRNYN